MEGVKVYCDRDCAAQEDGFCTNEAISILSDGTCSEYYEKDEE